MRRKKKFAVKKFQLTIIRIMERCEPLAVNWPKFEPLAGKKP